MPILNMVGGGGSDAEWKTTISANLHNAYQTFNLEGDGAIKQWALFPKKARSLYSSEVAWAVGTGDTIIYGALATSSATASGLSVSISNSVFRIDSETHILSTDGYYLYYIQE